MKQWSLSGGLVSAQQQPPCCQNLATTCGHVLAAHTLWSYSELITLYTQPVFTKLQRMCNITTETVRQ